MSNEELRAIVARTAKNIDKLSQELGVSAEDSEAASFLSIRRPRIVSLAEERKKTELAQQKTESLQQKTEAAIVSLVEEGKKTEVSIKELRKELGGVGGVQGDIAGDLFRRKGPGTLSEEQKKTEAFMRELRKEFERKGVGLRQEDIVKDLFGQNVVSVLEARKISVEKVEHKLKGPDAEFDITAINRQEIVIIEVKSRLRSSDIHDLIHRQIPLFKKYFGSDYKGHKIMGGLASMAVDPALEEEVEEAGLFLFTQTKEGGASLANSPDFVPKSY